MAINTTIPFGLNKDTGKLCDARQVKRGRACNCVCPECGAPLVACQGKKRKWHFKHDRECFEAQYCKHPIETSLHLKAKQLLSEASFIILPKVSYTPGNQVEEIVFAEPERFVITGVEQESRSDGRDVIPDIILFSGNRKVYVEILVTHAVDEHKLEKLHRRGVPTLEIDLSDSVDLEDITTEEDLKAIISEPDARKYWVYNSETYKLEQKVKSADRLEYTHAPFNYPYDEDGYRVFNCPFNTHVGYSFEHCDNCDYCISIEVDDSVNSQSGTIVCSARQGFSLKNSLLTAERIKQLISLGKEERKEKILSGQKNKSVDSSSEFQKSQIKANQSNEPKFEPVIMHPEEFDNPSIADNEESSVNSIEAVSVKNSKETKLNQGRDYAEIRFTEDGIEESTKIVMDAFGYRWFRCRVCKSIVREDRVWEHQYNWATCNNCNSIDDELKAHEKRKQELKLKQSETQKCPLCGGLLIKRVGPYGSFMGCSNYPKCKYTRSI